LGYVRPDLTTGKAAEIAAAIKGLQSQGAKGSSSTARPGTAEEGIAVADLLLTMDSMTYLEGQRTPKNEFQATPANTAAFAARGHDQPRYGGWSEIAASACLRKRAEVVGERRRDASVRRAISVNDGGAISCPWRSNIRRAARPSRTPAIPSVPSSSPRRSPNSRTRIIHRRRRLRKLRNRPKTTCSRRRSKF
jgi:hypothetical protein